MLIWISFLILWMLLTAAVYPEQTFQLFVRRGTFMQIKPAVSLRTVFLTNLVLIVQVLLDTLEIAFSCRLVYVIHTYGHATRHALGMAYACAALCVVSFVLLVRYAIHAFRVTDAYMLGRKAILEQQAAAQDEVAV